MRSANLTSESLLSVLRIPVEHHFARLKRFGILSGLYRGDQTLQSALVSGKSECILVLNWL